MMEVPAEVHDELSVSRAAAVDPDESPGTAAEIPLVERLQMLASSSHLLEARANRSSCVSDFAPVDKAAAGLIDISTHTRDHQRKRKLDQTTLLEPTKRSNFKHLTSFPLLNGDTVTARIQTDKYFPFTKRCVKVLYAYRASKLPGNLNHGTAMFRVFKRDYKEEFEALPRCGQKIGSQADIEEWRFQRRLRMVYSRLEEAFSCPRYLELWRSELGQDLHIPITAELDWDTGTVASTHSSLGCFGKYFGTKYQDDIMDSYSWTRLLNPYEAFFLSDCGTVQVTSCQCPLAVEDLRAILEANVPRFTNRYLVFSELLRTSRYSIKMYSEERQFHYNTVSVPSRNFSQPSSFVATYTGTAGKMAQARLGQYYKKLEGYPPSGFFSKTDVEQARKILRLPDELIEGTAPVSHLEETGDVDVTASSQSVGAEFGAIGRPLRGKYYQKGFQRPRPQGIDLAFFGCLKDFEWTPPVFDVAITDYRDSSVVMSDLFEVMERRKNLQLPLLIERVDCGQISGYSMTLARIPEVVFSGRTLLSTRSGNGLQRPYRS